LNSDLLRGFYLGDFLVDPHQGLVTGREGSVHLAPKALEVLLCLASAPGTTVSRDELTTEVWGEGQASPDALTHAISAIRHALDDHHNDPRYVQTLPKRGYRLLAAVRPVDDLQAEVLHDDPTHGKLPGVGLFDNLRKRGVLETAIAYLVVGWLLIQFADIVFEQLLFPAWAGTFVTVLVIGGFPIAVLLSWFLEFRDGRAIPHELSPRLDSRQRFSRTYLSVVGGLAVAAGLVFLYDQRIGLPQAEEIGRVDDPLIESVPQVLANSFAVLPFDNIDGSDETALFVNGLVDDVIARLTRVPGLLVSARGDAYTLQPHSPSGAVRRRLRVAHYLAGSVQISEDRMRVFVQLIDSESGFQILSRQFDRKIDDFFQLLDEITELTVANVRVALPASAPDALNISSHDPGLDVYVLYRRGVEASRVSGNRERIDATLDWFDKALAIDPGYAAAHAGKCAVYVEAYPLTDDPAYIDLAEAACARALNLNPNLDVVYTALGDLYAITGANESAEKAYLAALRLYGGNADALIGLGEIYRRQQRPVEAEESLRRATGLHPGDAAAYNALGTFLYRSGRYAEAAGQYRVVVELDKTNRHGFTNLGSALFLAGEFAAAEPEFRHAIELEAHPSTYRSLGVALYYLGRFDEAIEALRQGIELAPLDYLIRSTLGDTMMAAGREIPAVEAFRHAKDLALASLEVNPSDAFILMDLAWIHAVLGETELGSQLIERAKRLVPDDPYVYYSEGLVRYRTGDVDSTLAALTRAVELGYTPKLLARDPTLVGLRKDSRFTNLSQLGKKSTID
jgi:tetratricopeptide (TPR) repeat protein/DNA-binding winged helix-turn-helix (wHTH) protein